MVTLMILMIFGFAFITYGMFKVLWTIGPWLFTIADLVVFVVMIIAMVKIIAMWLINYLPLKRSLRNVLRLFSFLSKRKEIFMATEFNRHFWEIARVRHEDGSYPCETVRTIMWTLKMKPLEREWWSVI